ncbi:FkbM family methyltransferase [Aequorivita antarctica]|uniref:FkbM family methyltransferase n=1 Tax=Aequorivita antarctica TaxID=153266 RepID=A0A5C6YXS8_9FLAO|nr:FkbM family methyltransferase [Aequorivita antarctica]TXD72494.1 FkbM family methyltransferase [Aequorivita antarctica]SRX75628.1 31-O-demethyl-FK506 methyltransferase FkbM [Aequorivita antarctica]
MNATKQSIYRIKRVIQEIMLLRKNFYNWDSIIKRTINGKSVNTLNLRNGLNFYNANNNTLSIFKEIFVNKVYDQGEVKIKEGDVVFDIGANVGVFSLYASKIKGTQVFAFEPHPSNFKILLNNVNQNNIENIKCFDYALGSDNEDRILIEGNIAGGHKLSYKDVSQNAEGSLKVKSVTLASMKEKLSIDKIDFVKLDCEGAEGEIIQSLGLDGLKKINKIAIEFHDNHSILSHEQILKELHNAGFKTSLKWDGKSYFGYIYANK